MTFRASMPPESTSACIPLTVPIAVMLRSVTALPRPPVDGTRTATPLPAVTTLSEMIAGLGYEETLTPTVSPL